MSASGGVYNGGHDSVDIYARIFNSSGVAQGNEFQVNTSTNICANPAVAVASDNTFTIVWGENNLANRNNGWDIYGRQFTSPASGGPVLVVNSQLYGDQYGPHISVLGTDYLVVWTSMAQDGSREGVFGQYLRSGTKLGSEFQVNTTSLNSQIHPAVASDGVGQFLAVWSSFEQASLSMDIMAQRYINTNRLLAAPAAPVVSAIASYALSAAWAPIAGFNVDHWNLYVDQNNPPNTPALVTTSNTNTYWQNESLDGPYTNDFMDGSAHTFQLSYVLTDGRQSPLSGITTNSTWQSPRHGFDLPYDWETMYFGSNPANWKNSTYVLAPGVTVGMVFAWGGNPNDPSTWLVQSITHTSQGYFLNWNTQVGGIYQVQTTTSDTQGWVNLGPSRFAAGTSDSIYLGYATHSYYRIARLIY